VSLTTPTAGFLTLAIAVAAVVLRLRRGPIPAGLWTLLVAWTAAAFGPQVPHELPAPPQLVILIDESASMVRATRR
jgi:hypothetical protein